ncbi:MAG TPA: alpha/beta hydrolase [Marmoricola sp.]|nr:alpha/beta hydrolase [Marmoricola sp.]
MAQVTDWHEDILGFPYQSKVIPLPDDQEGEVVATLIRRQARSGSHASRAVLHIHGFADYFFQTIAADFWIEQGFDFYALDLRKYGRSLLPHQTPNYTTDLTTYYAELDLAWREIESHHREIVVSGHSTGGLVVSLWLDDNRPTAKGLFLNSPWLDFQGDLITRQIKIPVVEALGEYKPMVEIKRKTTGIYAKSLHRDYFGEWDFDLSLKPIGSFKAYAGWIRAIRIGQHRVSRGLDIAAPVLMISSTRSGNPPDNHHLDAATTDIVLDVEQMRRRVGAISDHVTIRRIPGAIHDVTLSSEPVRTEVFSQMANWLESALGW